MLMLVGRFAVVQLLCILSFSPLVYANNYDVNSDGKVNVVDLLLLQQEVLYPTPAQCNADGYEPNNTESASTFLGNVSGNDAQGSSLSAVYAPPDDEDWYVISISDQLFNTVDPAVTTTSSNPLKACIYYECTAGGTAPLTCPSGSTPDVSPGGKMGCCMTNPGQLHIQPQCLGTINTSGNAFIRITAAAGNAQCSDYTIQWHP